MPTYEYQCNKCNHTFEAFQQISEKPLKKCPECKGTIRRLIGKGAGIIFKGSGFYATDYRSKEYKEKKMKEKSPSQEKACPSCPLDKGKKSA